MNNKEKYKKICESKNVPLFSQWYWMDAVCGQSNWDVIIIEENGNVLGTLVYYLSMLDNGYEIRKAPLTQSNGILYYYPENIKYNRKLSFECKVADLIIDELEKLDIIKYRQYFHYSFTNWLPFYWRGYSQSTRYTYVIEDTNNLEKVYSNFNTNIRNGIKKNQDLLVVKNNMDPKEFYELNSQTFLRQNLDIPYSFLLFSKLYDNLKNNNCIEILYAIDDDNNIHSAILLAWDHDTVYYLMSGSNEEFRKSQSLTLLIYEGIKMAGNLGKKFDFEGSMKKNIESSFRQFGAVQKSYFDIQKEMSK